MAFDPVSARPRIAMQSLSMRACLRALIEPEPRKGGDEDEGLEGPRIGWEIAPRFRVKPQPPVGQRVGRRREQKEDRRQTRANPDPSEGLAEFER